MSAQRAEWVEDLDGNEMLDADTSAAMLRWMETALVPDGIAANQWELSKADASARLMMSILRGGTPIWRTPP